MKMKLYVVQNNCRDLESTTTGGVIVRELVPYSIICTSKWQQVKQKHKFGICKSLYFFHPNAHHIQMHIHSKKSLKLHVLQRMGNARAALPVCWNVRKSLPTEILLICLNSIRKYCIWIRLSFWGWCRTFHTNCFTQSCLIGCGFDLTRTNS